LAIKNRKIEDVKDPSIFLTHLDKLIMETGDLIVFEILETEKPENKIKFHTKFPSI
jgi:hypothetical protein